MLPEPAGEIRPAVNLFTAEDVTAILGEHNWLRSKDDAAASGGGPHLEPAMNGRGPHLEPAMNGGGLYLEPAMKWMAEAAALLGPRAANREALAHLLSLVFEYDAHTVLASRESQEVLARRGAREVLRALATEILGGGPVDSNRLKEIVAAVKARLPYSSREIFHPLRLALTGRVGEGELDRVVLLLDRAAQIKGLAPVKSVRVRILEFCAALD